MLNVYRSRESTDKEKFIYDLIRSRRPGQAAGSADDAAEAAGTPGRPQGPRNIVIVPDQYALVAERQAMDRLGDEVLLDVEITGFSRLGSNLLTEHERTARTFIDRYGRQMLLTRILREKDEELKVFRGNSDKESFISAIDDLISLIKQYEVVPAELAANAGEGTRLAEKLSDVAVIYEAYQAELAGKYTDREDLMAMYLEKMLVSERIEKSTVWIYGFDSFFPRNLKMIGAMAAKAREVNLFLTWDGRGRDSELFALGDTVLRKIKAAAADAGAAVRVEDLGPEVCPRSWESPAIGVIERELYAPDPVTSGDSSGVTVTQCRNIYSEAEAAASHILHLIRDEGLRLRDIMVICNDQTMRAKVAGRVFREYGLDIFDDSKRSIMGSPMIIFLLALLDVQAGGYRTGDIMRCIKTGLSPITDEEVEALDDYSVKYRINGSTWRKPFKYGLAEYGEEGFSAIEEIRVKAMDMMAPLREIYKSSRTNKEFCAAYYDYLVGSGLAERIEELALSQEEAGLPDAAEETAQVWSMAMEALSQLSELVGDDKFNGREFIAMIKAGLSRMEVGVIPPVVDDILLGTMPRTIPGDIKAMLVIGCNEGILPGDPKEDPLFSREELRTIAETAGDFGRLQDVRRMEEDLGIYRSLSRPSKDLWLSYSAADATGEELHCSEIIDRIRGIFPGLKVEEDPESSGDVRRLIGGRVNTLRHYTEAMHAAGDREPDDPAWRVVGEWLSEVDDEGLAMVRSAIGSDNSAAPLPQELAGELYLTRWDGSRRKDLSVSPSRMEKFSRCPFSHFISYGLRPEERRTFEVGSRDVGDIYHTVVMQVSRELTDAGTWMTVAPEELMAMVDGAFDAAAGELREGVLGASKADSYKAERARKNCRLTCENLVRQYRAGRIAESRFEVYFGRGGGIAPIVRQIKGGTVYIEGKIDRVDILEDGRVKIIDYKTGKEEFNVDDARGGYRLQLMLYLKAAQEEEAEPAGVFYFLMRDPELDENKLSGQGALNEKIDAALRRHFRMNGVMVGSDDVVSEVDGNIEDYSDIIPVQSTKDGIKGTTGNFLLSEEEFRDLQEEVDRKVDSLLEDMVSGSIDIRPMVPIKGDVPCRYCDFHGICRFDTAFSGNRYEHIKK